MSCLGLWLLDIFVHFQILEFVAALEINNIGNVHRQV